MKKVMSILVILLVASAVIAGMSANEKGSFYVTGDSGSLTIDRGNGTIIDTQMTVYQETNKTVSIYPASLETKFNTAYSSATTVTVYTASSNVLAGYTLTTSDYLLAYNQSSGWQLSKISTVGAYASYIQTYVIATAITVSANDPVYVCKAGDILAYAGITAGTPLTIKDAFTGKLNAPVHIAYPAGAGASAHVTGTYSIEK